ncbi:MAG: DUF2975 domain-containing protein [Clostridia bacterium]|nr:DUF2975 domain-containing protein [Clostridia bacterium]
MFVIDRKTSASLSTILTLIVLVILIIAVPALPFITYFFLHAAHPVLLETSYYPILVILYTALIPAFAADIALLRLLGNVRRDSVFSSSSVAYLRLISWCCFAEAVIFAAFGIFFALSFFLSFAALFMGLILRVVKNVIEDAAEIKSENDLTV